MLSTYMRNSFDKVLAGNAQSIRHKGSENVSEQNIILMVAVFQCKENYLKSSGFTLHKLERHHLPASQIISRNSKCV